jgi:hypothetical protein
LAFVNWLLIFTWPKYNKDIVSTFSFEFQRAVPNGSWKSLHNVRAKLNYMAPKLGVKCLDDWQLVTHEQFNKENGALLLACVPNDIFNT